MSRRWPASRPRTGVNVDEVVALGAAIQAAIEVGQKIGDAVPRFTLSAASTAGGRRTSAATTSRRVTDVMSHSLGTIAVSPDGSAYVNDIVIRRNLPIPARNTKSYLHETHGGANTKLEVYLTQGESTAPLDCTILGKYVFDGIHPDRCRGHGRRGHCRTIPTASCRSRPFSATPRHRLPMRVEPVPDDLSWLGRPPEVAAVDGEPELIRVFLLIDVSASMTGRPWSRPRRRRASFCPSATSRPSRSA